MKEIIEQLAGFENELDNNKHIIKEKFMLDETSADTSLISIQRELKRIESTVLDYYELNNGIEIRWKPVDPDIMKQDVLGSVKINAFANVVRDWNGVVFFDKEAADSEIRKFFPVDFFADEAATGFCTKEGWRNMMYLFRFEGELIPLHVNFQSYLELMLLAKCTFYWQYLIVEINEGQENEVSTRIKQYLPKLFPDFSFENFERAYSELHVK